MIVRGLGRGKLNPAFYRLSRTRIVVAGLIN